MKEVDQHTREATKIMLASPGEGFVIVSGKSGRRNLPGGGVDHGESHEEALNRELLEEIGVGLNSVSNLQRMGDVSATVSTASHDNFRALWHVFSGQLILPRLELTPHSEIMSLEFLSPDEIRRHAHISTLAQQAMTLFLEGPHSHPLKSRQTML